MKLHLFPAKTSGLIFFLIVAIIVLGFIKVKTANTPVTNFVQCAQSTTSSLNTKGAQTICATKDGQEFYAEFPDTMGASPTMAPTLSPAPSPTVIPINPTTGARQIKNDTYKFLIEISDEWDIQAYNPITDPLLTLTANEGDNAVGVILTSLNQPTDIITDQLPNPIPYRYGTWRGTITTTTDAIPTEIIMLTPNASNSPQLRVTWARVNPQTNPHTPANLLHPLLDSIVTSP